MSAKEISNLLRSDSDILKGESMMHIILEKAGTNKHFSVDRADDCVWLTDLRGKKRIVHMTKDQARGVGKDLTEISKSFIILEKARTKGAKDVKKRHKRRSVKELQDSIRFLRHKAARAGGQRVRAITLAALEREQEELEKLSPFEKAKKKNDLPEKKDEEEKEKPEDSETEVGHVILIPGSEEEAEVTAVGKDGVTARDDKGNRFQIIHENVETNDKGNKKVKNKKGKVKDEDSLESKVPTKEDKDKVREKEGKKLPKDEDKEEKEEEGKSEKEKIKEPLDSNLIKKKEKEKSEKKQSVEGFIKREKYGEGDWIQASVIAEMMDVSFSVIKKELKKLEEKGMIQFQADNKRGDVLYKYTGATRSPNEAKANRFKEQEEQEKKDKKPKREKEDKKKVEKSGVEYYTTIDEEFEKARVKGFIRTRRGHLERVSEHYRNQKAKDEVAIDLKGDKKEVLDDMFYDKHLGLSGHDPDKESVQEVRTLLKMNNLKTKQYVLIHNFENPDSTEVDAEVRGFDHGYHYGSKHKTVDDAYDHFSKKGFVKEFTIDG